MSGRRRSSTFALLLDERAQGASIETARTVAVSTLVAFEICHLLNAAT